MSTSTITIRPVSELDASAIEGIDEKITKQYRPDHWENQVRYYLTRDPESALIAECEGEVVGFMFGDIRGWEFGFEKPTGWIEVVGIDPDQQGKKIGKELAAALFAHWREKKVESVRTLVDNKDADIAGFMRSVGLAPSEITAFEMSL